MTTEQMIGLILALFVMCLGMAGSIFPGIPNTPLVLFAGLADKPYFGDS